MFSGGCSILGWKEASILLSMATLGVYLGVSCDREPEPPKLSPVELAQRHVDEHVESYSNEIAAFMVRGLPVVKDVLGDHIEKQVRETAQWHFTQTDTLGGGRFEVTAVAAADVPLDIEVPDVDQRVTGRIRVGVPFFIEVDHNDQAVIDTVVDYDRAVLDIAVNGLEEAVKQKALQVGAGVAGSVADKALELLDENKSDLWEKLSE